MGTVISTITVGLLVNASAFMYATFYYAFVPAPEHEGPLNPTFEPCGPKDNSMLRCGFLNASRVIGGVGGPVLMAGQDYTATVMLDMPESGEHEAGHVHELPATEVGGGRRGEGGVQ